jgi:anti-sigma regulatory factor (Ser/Thr protein kinase)
MLGLQLRDMGPGKVTLPSSVQNYAVRMRLWECIDQKPPVTVKAKPTEARFCPMRRLRKRETVGDLAADLALLVKEQSKDCDEETYASVFSMLSELMDNSFAHAVEGDNETRGLVCAQTWTSGGLAQIAIADHGIGIRSSFEASEKWRGAVKTRNACELATEYGVTSKTQGHSGYGLTLVRGLAQTSAANLIIMSRQELFRVSPSGAKHEVTVAADWLGTLVLFEWRINKPLDSAAVYASWPDSADAL